ncbi:MAG: iron-containing alcohol dehydrogenase, partial [Desulfosarcinaceae bacterium]
FMKFAFSTANEILFGPGTLQAGAGKISRMAKRVMVVTGCNRRRARALTDLLARAGTDHVLFSVGGEPKVQDARDGAEIARREKVDAVVGFGGGGALDGAKAVAALAANTEPVETYLEVIGQGLPLPNRPLACIAVPTTAGTGSEVTRNAVLCSPEHRVKVSLRSPMMLPCLAIVDPETTYELPPEITAATGCDALTQLLEAYVSSKANPMTDAFCRQGLPGAAQALETVYEDGGNTRARSRMALAALFSGLALANGGLGAVHGIAGPLGGMLEASHGAVCAALLPHVFAVNFSLISRRAPQSPVMARFGKTARMITGSSSARAADGIAALHRLTSGLKIPPLSRWGLTPAQVPELVAKAGKASSMKGNPIELTPGDIEEIIQRAM